MTTPPDAIVDSAEIELVLAELTVHARLDHNRRNRPHQIALRCGERTATFSALHERTVHIADALHVAGIRSGDRVAFLGLESIDYYALVFACARTGVVLVPINFRLTDHEVEHILDDSGARLLISDPERLPGLQASAAVQGGITLVSTEETDYEGWISTGFRGAGDPDRVAGPQLAGDTELVQLYTSGTTGLPKGVVLGHRSFFAVATALALSGREWIDWREGDVNLVGIPGFHIGGLWWALQSLNAGITTVILPRFEAETAVHAIASYRVSTVCMVPSMIALLLSGPATHSESFHSVRKVVYGGSPIGEPLLNRAMDIMDCEFVQIYGLTETGNTALCLTPEDHRLGGERLRAAGRPYPGLAVKVVNRQGQAVPLGEVGEICLRTPARMLGYWNRPEATASTLVDGWIHTGDAGYLDAHGLVHICDRIKDMIIVGGENIYPAEIERVLLDHPEVADAAVIGVPDPEYGEAVVAFVVARPGCEPAPRSLFTHCREHLATFKIPARFERIATLPRNPSGKILRRELRESWWSGYARRVN